MATANPFDQFDSDPPANPFDQFDEAPVAAAVPETPAEPRVKPTRGRIPYPETPVEEPENRDYQKAAVSAVQEAFSRRERLGVPETGPLQFSPIPDNIDPKERGLIEYHRENLRRGTHLDDEQGVTTVNITGVTGPDGRIYNVPGYADGKRLTPEEAWSRADRNGWDNYPAYENGDYSNERARAVHGVIEQDADAFRAFNQRPSRATGQLGRVSRTALAPDDPGYVKPTAYEEYDPDPDNSEQSQTGAFLRAIPAGAINTAANLPEALALKGRQQQAAIVAAGVGLPYVNAYTNGQYSNFMRQVAGSSLPLDDKSKLMDAIKAIRRGRVPKVHIEDFAKRYADNTAQDVRDALKNFAEEQFAIDPAMRDKLTTKVGEGLGSTLTFLFARMIPGGQVLLPMTAGMMGQGEAIARAAKNGADNETQALAGLMGIVPGMTDAIPIERMFRPLNFLPGAKGAIINMAKEMVQQGVIEGSQEAVQNWMQNAIQKILTKPAQDINEGVAEGALVGFLVGAIFGAGGSAAKRISAPEPGAAETFAEGAGGIPGDYQVPDSPPPAPTGAAQSREQLLEDMRDPRPAAEIAAARQAEAEQARLDAALAEEEAAAAVQPPVEPIEPPPGDAPPDDLPKTAVTVTYNDGGDTYTGTIVDTYSVEDPNTGEAVDGIDLQTEDGVMQVLLSDVTVGPASTDFQTGQDNWDALPDDAGTAAAPIKVETGADVDAAATNVNPDPTDAQKEAGNYQKGHIKWQGLDMSIETARGQERRGVGPEGDEWSVTLPADYGYIKRTEGADGDQVDVYMGPNPESDAVFVVDQIDPETGEFDEHKVMLGFADRQAASNAYGGAFSDGSAEARAGAVTEMSADEFKTWLKNGDTKTPVAYQPDEEDLDAIFDEELANVFDQFDGDTEIPAPADGLDAPSQAVEPGGAAPEQVVTPASEPATDSSEDFDTAKAQMLEAREQFRRGEIGAAVWIKAKRKYDEANDKRVADQDADRSRRLAAGELDKYEKEIQDRFDDLDRKTTAAEKDQEKEPWSKEAQAAWDKFGQGREFSEARGYTPEEIEDYEDFIRAAEEYDGVFGEGAAQERSYENAQEAKAEQPNPYDQFDEAASDHDDIADGKVPVADARAEEKKRRLKELEDQGITPQMTAGDHTEIGKNADGETVYEDKRGVRSVTDGKIRQFETVTISPRGLEQPRTPRDPRYEVAAKSKPDQETAVRDLETGEIVDTSDEADRLYIEIDEDNPMPVDSFEDASKRFRAVIDKAGVGASEAMTPIIRDGNGKQIAYISYNGRVWRGKPGDDAYKDKAANLLYDPQDEDKTGKLSDNSSSNEGGKINTAPNAPQLGPVSDAIAEYLLDGNKFRSIADARSFVSKITGNKIEPGTQDAKIADEQIEVGVVMAARTIVQRGGDPKAIYDDLVDLYGRQPSLSTRTSTSIANQAYSTPVPMAYIASRLAGIDRETAVYEPTAGNGALLLEASEDKTVINELDSDRAAALGKMFPNAQILTNNAVEFQPGAKSADVVIANPPFGIVKDDKGNTIRYQVDDRYSTAEVDHAIVMNSLKAMKDDGRAVLLIGGINKLAKTEEARSDAYNGKAKREFFLTLYGEYNVVDHFTVAGELYARQGAGWPIDIIVIDGRGKSQNPLPAVSPPRIYDTWAAVSEVLDGTNTDTGSTRRAGRSPGDTVERGSEPDGNDGRTGPSDDGVGPDTGRGVSAAGQPGGLRAGRDLGQRKSGGTPDTETAPDTAPEEPADNRTDPGADPVTPASGSTLLKDFRTFAVKAMFDMPFLTDGWNGTDTDNGIELTSSVIAPRETAVVTEKDGALDVSIKGAPGPNYHPNQNALHSRVRFLVRTFNESRPPAPAPTLKDAAKDTVVDTAMGFDEALNSLAELFGGGKTIGAGPAFDEETWRRAKPFFTRAAKRFHKAGQSARQTMRLLIAHLKNVANFTAEMIRDMQQYVVRFVSELQSGAISLETETAPAPRPRGDLAEDSKSGRQVTYTPASAGNPMGTLVPVNMQTAISTALKTLGDRVGGIDAYVADQLGYKQDELNDYFGAEQIDAIALAIANMAKGAGFIIGDQTGIGKGRVVASMIRFAIKQGRTPIFVTEKPNLYADMYRDLTDIGIDKMLGREIKILATDSGLKLDLNEKGTVQIQNKGSAAHTALLRSRAAEDILDEDVIFTTYTQMQTIKGEATERMRFIEHFARGGILILDESHNAGGTTVTARGGGKKEEDSDQKQVLNRATFTRSLTRQAHGVFYSSATYAKRPEVMDLYATTDMKLAVSNISELGDAIRKGGVPMQQVVATMLTEAGQYVRRERSFDGIEYRTPTVKVDQQVYSTYAQILKSIQLFSDDHVKGSVKGMDKALKAGGKSISHDGSTGGAGASSTNFTATMHNLIDQMLLSITSDAAADLAIEAHKNGEKPVITVANTMGTFIGQMATDLGLNNGDVINLNFNDLMTRYLERSRTIMIKQPFSKEKGEKHYLTDTELGSAGVAAYNAARDQIADADLSSLPISPVDHMHKRLQDAGLKTGEIMGRSHTIEYRSDGKAYYRVRPAKEVGVVGRDKAIKGFNNGRLDALIVNQSGATGISLHASEKFKDQKPRRMIVAQSERNIDTHMQLLGRVHRTGQVVLPSFDQLVADIPATKRPAAILAKKMAELNANTTASRKTELTADDAPDFMNEYGDEIAARMMEDNPDLHQWMGNPLKTSENSGEGLSRDGAIRTVTGRIPLLPVQQQIDIYEMIEGEYAALVQQKEAAGESILEAKTLELDARSIEKKAVVASSGIGSPFQQGVYLETFDVKRLGRPHPKAEVERMVAETLDGKTDREFMTELAGPHLSEFDAYKRMSVDETSVAATARNIEERLDLVRQRFMGLGRVLLPGTTVKLLSSTQNYYGVVTKVVKSGNPKNPLALGSWKATFALADAAKQMTVPFSQLFLSGEGLESLTAINVERATKIGDLPVWDAFDQMQSESREERTIFTGNILTAYTHTNGKGAIINFHDDAGTMRQGILMPRDYDYEKERSEQPVLFQTAAQVLEFLDRVGEVKSSDTNILLTKSGGNIRIEISASKRDGGQYYLDRGVLDAVGQDFVSVGNRMRADVSSDKAPAIIDAMKNVGAGFMATKDKQIATEIVAQVEGGRSRPAESFQRPGPSPFPQAPATNTPKFKRWFGDSKVVDDNGEPLVVYHGTNAEFEEFSIENDGFPNDAVVFFSGDKNIAEEFVGLNGNDRDASPGGERVVSAYLSVKNPAFIGNIEDEITIEGLFERAGIEFGDIPLYLQDLAGEEQSLWSWYTENSEVWQAFKKAGFDGAYGSERGAPLYVAFSPEQIKSVHNNGEFSPDRPSIMEQRPGADANGRGVFFSALTRAVEGFTQPRGSVRQWSAMIRKAPGVKQAEIEWSGVMEWLEGQTGSISRDDLVAFLKSNEVQVEEVVRGGESHVGRDKAIAAANRGENVYQVMSDGRPNYDMPVLGSQIERLFTPEDDVKFVIGNAATKFATYTLPGGVNYRELLLTLPTDVAKESAARSARITELVNRRDGYRTDLARAGSAQERQRLTTLIENTGRQIDMVMRERDDAGTRTAFTGGHYDEPNILAHVRFNERTDADGKRVLFIEEIQSDWHQKGRKIGYGGKQAWRVLHDDGRWYSSFTDKDLAEEAAKKIGGTVKEYRVETVPDAPFKTTWHELAFKRALRWATENGFDSVAWTTGEQQADRYDLSKQVDAIGWKTDSKGVKRVHIETKGGGSNIRFEIDENGLAQQDSEASMAIHRDIVGKPLEDIVGKEIAEKIHASKFDNLFGVDLKIGGEGMKGFYDQMLPRFANKYAKKWGAKVGTAEVPTGTESVYGGNPQTGILRTVGLSTATKVTTETVHTLPITDAMRESVNAGQPLFQRPTAASESQALSQRARSSFRSDTRPVYTDAFKKQRPAILKALRAELDRLGMPEVDLALPDSIRDPKTGDISAYGTFFNGQGIMEVALGQPHNERFDTLHHEVIHAMRDAGLFTDEEWEILSNDARKKWIKLHQIEERYDGASTAVKIEESIADEYKAHASGTRPAVGRIRAIFRKIKRFLNAVRNALNGLGFRTVEDIFEDIDSGTIGARPRRQSAPSFTDPVPKEEFKAQVAETFGPDADANSLLRQGRKRMGEMFQRIDDAGGNGTISEASEGEEPGSIQIIERKDARDLNVVKKWIYKPQNAFKRWPQLVELVNFGVKTEVGISKFSRRINAQYDHAWELLNDERKAKVTELLLSGDAERVTYTDDDLAQLGADEETIAGYKAMRTLFETVGRFVDQHRRSMKPAYRNRKLAILKRMRSLRDMSDPEFRKLYNKRSSIRDKLRNGTGNPEKLVTELGIVESQLQAKRENTEEFQQLLGEIDRIDAALAATSIRNIEGYFPHQFIGSWAVYEMVDVENEETGEMETEYKLIAGTDGFHPDRKTAVDAAKAVLAARGNAHLVVRPVQFSYPSEEATELTDGSYYRFLKNAGDALELEGDELRQVIQGVARKPFRRRIAGFTQHRKGVEGFSKDVDAVVRRHITEAVRYVMLDKLKYEAISTMERMGLSRARSANSQHEVLSAAVQEWFRDVNGQKQPVESYLDHLLSREWATPIRLAMAVGGAVGLMAAPASDWMVGAALGSYMASVMYRGLKNGGEFKTRSITGTMLADMAHLKLGFVLNVMTSVVNLSQTLINTIPTIGMIPTFKGIALLEKASMSRLRAQPNVPGGRQPDRYWRLLERADVVTEYRFSEATGNRIAREGKLKRASLFLFDNAERFNRAVAFLGAYQQAIDEFGWSEARAFAYGEKMMLQTQHHYGNASKPQVLRNVLGRVPLQFKNYPAQQIAFIVGLPPEKLAKYLLALFLFAGTLGLPGIKELDDLLMALFGFSPLLEMKRLALKAQAEGEAVGNAAMVLLRGLPSLMDEDLSRRIGNEDLLPKTMRDFKGPWFSTIEGHLKMGETGATIGDHMKNASSGLRWGKMLEAAANGLPLSDAYKPQFWEAIAKGDISLTNPWKGGYLEMDERQIDHIDLARMAVGSTPMIVSQNRDIMQLGEHDKKIQTAKTRKLLQELVHGFKLYQDPKDIEQLNKVIRGVQDAANKDNIELSADQINNAVNSTITNPRALRQIKQMRKSLRPELIGHIREVNPGLTK